MPEHQARAGGGHVARAWTALAGHAPHGHSPPAPRKIASASSPIPLPRFFFLPGPRRSLCEGGSRLAITSAPARSSLGPPAPPPSGSSMRAVALGEGGSPLRPLARPRPPQDPTKRGEVNVTERRRSAVHRPSAGGLLGRAADDMSAKTRVQRRHFASPLLSDSRGSCRRDRGRSGIGSTQRDSAGLVRGFGDECCAGAIACRVSFCRRRRRRWADCFNCGNAALISASRRDRRFGR